MVLLVEQVRSLGDEQDLVNDAAGAASPSAFHNWTTRVTKSITLSKEKLVFIQWDSRVQNGSGAGRVCIAGVPFASSGTLDSYATTTRRVFVLLSAGAYSLTFQTALWSKGTGGFVAIENIRAAAFVFSDMTSYTVDSGAVNVNSGSTTTIKTQDIAIPSARKLPVGSTKKYSVYIVAYMHNTTERYNYPMNPGESDTASACNWKLSWEGTQQSWTDRLTDYSTYVAYTNYGIGAFGTFVKEADAGDTVTLLFQVKNSSAGSRSCRVYFRVFVCPWVLLDSLSTHEPAGLDFPQGSTFYAMLEPLAADSSKSSKIGRVRGISFGDASDFYSIVAGVGLLEHSYVFDYVGVGDVSWIVGGLNCCISYVGVDVR